MHYIRLVRPASVNTLNPHAPILTLKLSITTDLGDTFLSTDEPIELYFVPSSNGQHNSGIGLPTLAPTNGLDGGVYWKSGMRVLKVELPLTKELASGRASIRIDSRRCGKAHISADTTEMLLPWHMGESGVTTGLVAPLEFEFTDGIGSDVAFRPFLSRALSRPLRIEEEIGESIARHIWDAGLVTTALLADSCLNKSCENRICDLMPIEKDAINVLELGSGVGILGLGIGRILYQAARVQGVRLESATVLLTDLPEAEERARANIKREQNGIHASEPQADMLYENLDWDDGSNGSFGPLVSSRFWDYIVLSDCTYNVDSFPVLVATLSELHSHNIKHASADKACLRKTKVILSTKPRHDSEKALFDLLEKAGWNYRLMKSVPIMKLGDEDEVVELYSLEKGRSSAIGVSKKRKNGDDAGKPSKKGATA